MNNKIKKLFKPKNMNKKFMLTFTKKWVTRLMWFSIIAVALNYAMAIFSFKLGIDSEVIIAMVDLSKHIITMIIGVMLAYMVKAFWETYMEEKTRASLPDLPTEETNLDDFLEDDEEE